MTLVETKKRKKSMKMGDIASAEEEDEPDDIPEGFHLQEESPHCINMKQSRRLSGLLSGRLSLNFETNNKKWSDQHLGRVRKGYSEHVLGGKGQ